MKYSFAFLLLTLSLTLLVIHLGGFAYALLWLAFDFLLLAVSYFGLGPLLFGKKKGRLALWSKLLFLPYLLLNGFIWHIYRLVNKENAFDKVGELMLSRRLLANEMPAGVVNVIDLTSEFDEAKEIRDLPNYTCLPILDGSVPANSKDLDSILNSLAPGLTLVHCAQGHGRTGLFAVLYLLRFLFLSLSLYLSFFTSLLLYL